MKRFACQLCLGLGLIASSAGCLSTTGTVASMRPETSIGSGSIGKEQKLSDKDTAALQLNIADELEKNSYLADAADRYEKARQLDPNLKHVCRRLALLYDKMGNERKALEEYDEAIKLAPKDADVMNDLGYCHYNRGRWTEAETCFRHALAINAKNKRANVNLGLALAQQSRIDEAMDCFLKVTRPAEAKANVAFVLAAQGKKGESKALYQEALKLEPGLLAAQNGLAALNAPKKAELPDAPIRTAKCEAPGCTDGLCPTVKTPLPDMSPITIDPRTSRQTRTEDRSKPPELP